ncbi:DUF2891 domain-containing protein [Pseudotenacibaculum sp. MALMAid0570]|uniref:DUF2891 domain-containing protein n=1 Tax=Pseudotenacibaculum sp. MALMAid0570 TaxID=3143938 RepID=UPI0032DE3FD5
MRYIYLIGLFFLMSCNQTKEETKKNVTKTSLVTPKLTLEQAKRLIQLPVHCINVEYPNKLNQTIGGNEDLQSPKELHPAFYGCFDWHSSVHGHWSLVSLIKQFPNLENAEEVKKMLLTNISKENIEKEVAYFFGKHNKSYERTYGWAWLLKLAEELHTWDNETARELEKNLQPLTDLIAKKYIEFLPKLKYPIRVGEHTNTAFGLTFAWDYANTVGNKELKDIIEKRSKEFFMKDADCPITWEPSGYDFLSPCLQEAAMMKRVLSKEEFARWFAKFLPELKSPDYQLAVGEVSDRKDGKLVHLDGVNFSRAWCLYTIVKDMPEYDHLKNIAAEHINYSLPNLVGDSYEGGHWLGSFAIYALNTSTDD